MTNLALFPASLLARSEQFNQLLHSLPEPSCLIVLPPSPSPTWDSLFGLAAVLELEGLQVEILEADWN